MSSTESFSSVVLEHILPNLISFIIGYRGGYHWTCTRPAFVFNVIRYMNFKVREFRINPYSNIKL